jgi:hypothetical protein
MPVAVNVNEVSPAVKASPPPACKVLDVTAPLKFAAAPVSTPVVVGLALIITFPVPVIGLETRPLEPSVNMACDAVVEENTGAAVKVATLETPRVPGIVTAPAVEIRRPLVAPPRVLDGVITKASPSELSSPVDQSKTWLEYVTNPSPPDAPPEETTIRPCDAVFVLSEL